MRWCNLQNFIMDLHLPSSKLAALCIAALTCVVLIEKEVFSISVPILHTP